MLRGDLSTGAIEHTVAIGVDGLLHDAKQASASGNFGGLWSKSAWFVFGLAMSLMALSGLLVWTKRTAKATARLRREPEEPRGPTALPKPKPVPAEPLASS